jgi:hypothetical protein
MADVIQTKRHFWAARRAFIAVAAIYALFTQVIGAGFAVGSLHGGSEGAFFFGQICALEKAQRSNDTSPRPVTHHVGACCIVHTTAFKEPDPGPAAIVELASRPRNWAPFGSYLVGGFGANPELHPLSARAPPLDRA